MDPLVLGSIIQSGASVANTGGNLLSNGIFGRRNRDWARQDATTAYNRQRQLLADERAYSSPAAEMQRYIDAGLNPNLIYGQQQGVIGAPSVPQASTPSVAPPQMALDGSAFLNSQLMKAQIDKLNKDSDLSAAQAKRIYKLTDAEYNKLDAEFNKLKNENDLISYDATVNRFKTEALGDGTGLYRFIDENGNDVVTDFKSLVLDENFYKLYSSNLDYKKAIKLFASEIGIVEGNAEKINLENKDLREFVKVCADIYKSDAKQAQFLSLIADLNVDFFNSLKASPILAKAVVSFITDAMKLLGNYHSHSNR